MNWNKWFKLFVLLQVSFLAFLGPFSQGAIVCEWLIAKRGRLAERVVLHTDVTQNAAYAELAEYLNISITTASYNTTLAIVFAGIAPLVWSPLANVYGRRPIYLLISIIGIIAGAGCAIATEWGPLLVARVFVGIGTSPGMGIGASVVSDLYFTHERGRYIDPLSECSVACHVTDLV